MKAQNYLKQIKIMNAKINREQEELEVLEALATRTTSTLTADRVQTSISDERMADCVIEIAEMRTEINRNIDKYMNYRSKAKQLLDECSADCMQLLHKRYFLDKTWEEIAVELGLSYHWVSGGLHQKALSQYQKAMDKAGELLWQKN